MKKVNLAGVFTVAVFIICTTSLAWGAGFAVQVPSVDQTPGNVFSAAITVNTGSYSLKSYRVRLLYNPNIIKPIGPTLGTHTEFTRPLTADFFFAFEIELFDTNNYTQGCTATGTFDVASMEFLALEGAPSNNGSPIRVYVDEVIDCNNNNVTSNFNTNVNGTPTIARPVVTTSGITQYLDLNGDGYFNSTDTALMRAIVSGDISNTGNMSLNVGGLQGDINGNGFPEMYDYGYMMAMTGVYSWCSTGPNGIAQNPASGDDVQLIALTQGKPNMPDISSGPNSVLNTTPAGDDQIVNVGGGGPHNWISTGANGRSETTAAGDDVQLIPVTQGFPYAEMIKPGVNGVIDSSCTAIGDDTNHSFSKNTTSLLTNFPAPGQPVNIVKVAPTQNPVFVRRYFDLPTQTYLFPPVPLVVRIEDEDGNPKVGLAPSFTVTQGAGYFDGPTGPATSIDGIVSDRYLRMGNFPKGTSVIVFHPVMGNNVVTVSLAGDSSKGVLPATPIQFNIQALDILLGNEFPDTVTVQAQSHSSEPGLPVPVTITLKKGTNPVHGLQDRIILATQRNMFMGVNPNPNGLETGTAIFSDPFETFTFPVSPSGMWTVLQGGSRIFRDMSNPGMFGSYGLRITGGGVTNPSVFRHVINTVQYSNIQLSYQWSFVGNPLDGSYIKVEYSTDGGATWRLAQLATGLAGLRCSGGCTGQMNLETRNLAGDSSAARITNFIIQFTFAGGTGGTFWLDNARLDGIKLLYEEDFEGTGQAVGSPPSGFDPVNRITTGPDGIVQTSAQTGDTQRIPVGQGEQNQTCILPSLDKTLNSTVGGDDVHDTFNNLINTGVNGICETTAVGDDFQVLPLNQGLPFAVAITPGTDGTIVTTAGGDDELQSSMWTNHAVVVDNTIGLTTGPNQGHNNSQKFAKIGRTSLGSAPAQYALRKIINVAGMDNLWLKAWTHTFGQANISGAEPGQKWLCEVSDNGGASFIPVWDSSDSEENVWTMHKVCISCDPRINLGGELIIQWRAAMDNPETGTSDHDAAFVDDIQIFGTPRPPDVFGPITDTYDGGGHYTTTLTSTMPGTAWMTAFVLPYDNSQTPPFADPGDYVNFGLRTVNPNSLRTLPATFNIKACETVDFMAVGHYSDQPGTIVNDVSHLYHFVVNGSAHITPDGHLSADCFVPGQRLSIKVNALPQVEGLYDPSGDGSGQQTGYLTGKVFSSSFPYPVIASARVRMTGTASYSSSSAADGSYFKSGVAVYSNYSVQAMKNGYVADQDNAISVVAGSTTTDNLFMPTGSDTDGDGTTDTNDTDDDNDGVTDSNETVKGTTRTDPDTDGDGYGDSTDVFPTNSSEWADNDSDGTGDNADTDDDNDGILDTEEIAPGTDGYITNPKSADTDGDTLGDYAEVHTYLTDPSKADTDGGGRADNVELALGKNPRYGYWNDDNYAPTGYAGPDLYAAQSATVYLSGNASTDPENDTINYTWVQLAGPAAMTLNNANTAFAYFDATFQGTYTFSVKVKDNFTPQAWGTPDNVVVTVGANGTDSDGDGLPNLFEAVLGSNPNNSDSDGDTILDQHDYLNSTTNINTSDKRCYSGDVSFSLFCWADEDGDGLITTFDLAMYANYFNAQPVTYGVYPDNGDTGDIDGDMLVTTFDFAVLVNIFNGQDPTSFYIPGSITKIVPAVNPTVPIGATQLIKVRVKNTRSPTTPMAGVGVLFTITGNGVLLGGRGDAAGLADPDGGIFPAGSRWDVTGPQDSGNGGIATMTVKVTGAGPITIGVRIPSNSAKYFYSPISLSPSITINP